MLPVQPGTWYVDVQITFRLVGDDQPYHWMVRYHVNGDCEAHPPVLNDTAGMLFSELAFHAAKDRLACMNAGDDGSGNIPMDAFLDEDAEITVLGQVRSPEEAEQMLADAREKMAKKGFREVKSPKENK